MTSTQDRKNEPIKRAAVRVNQGGKTLFVTYFRASDFEIPDFYRIDRLDPQNQGGYQRLLQEERANRLKRYLAEAWAENQQAFLPTSVFLATERDIKFDETRNEICFRPTEVCPFDVVDGQHRIEGLLRAAKENPELKDFPIVANIAINMQEVEQMLHFYVVNTTQRPVDPSVGQQIRARFFSKLETESLPYIPSWIKGQIVAGTDYQAINMLNSLNSEEDSPWFGKIQMANDPRNSQQHTIKQNSFVTGLKKGVLIGGHPLSMMGDPDLRNRIFKNYWIAVDRIFVDSETKHNTVVYKSTGALFFCRVSSAVIHRAHWEKAYKVDDFTQIIESTREHLPSNLLPIMTPEFWESGNDASGMNSGAVDKMAVEFNQAITAAAQSMVEL